MTGNNFMCSHFVSQFLKLVTHIIVKNGTILCMKYFDIDFWHFV